MVISNGRNLLDRSGFGVFEDNRDSFADRRRGALHCFQQNLVVIGIKERIKLAAAGVDAPGHLQFADALGFHTFGNLPRQGSLNGLGGDVFVSAVFLEEILKGRTNAFLAHRSISFFRFIARSRSLSGICVVLARSNASSVGAGVVAGWSGPACSQGGATRGGARRFRLGALTRVLLSAMPPSRRLLDNPIPVSMPTTSSNKAGCLSSTLNSFISATGGLVLPLS